MNFVHDLATLTSLLQYRLFYPQSFFRDSLAHCMSDLIGFVKAGYQLKLAFLMFNLTK